MALSGYSGTPLARKLGIKTGYAIHLVNKPEHYFELFDDFPDNVELQPKLEKECLDFIHIFASLESELVRYADQAKPLLKKSGTLWVSWPKGSSKLPKEINRESVREYLLSIGLVDIKVCSIDNDWSALKFMYRTKDR